MTTLFYTLILFTVYIVCDFHDHLLIANFQTTIGPGGNTLRNTITLRVNLFRKPLSPMCDL